MADKDNDNKFMSMLERMGMVRKIDSDDPGAEAVADETPAPQERLPEDGKPDPVFHEAAERPDAIIGGSRQPAPGMSDPTMPPRPTPPDAFAERVSVPANSATGRLGWEEPDEPQEQWRPARDAYADKYLGIEELYESLSMKSSGTDTIYLIEEYLKSLPPSLPDESRREIITKILSASGFNFDSLIGDGMLRAARLKEYAEQFARRTDDYMASRNDDLAVLERQMQDIRNMIDSRRELHKKQIFAIEAEAQRLKDILSFISD